jgi:hypothetical protein
VECWRIDEVRGEHPRSPNAERRTMNAERRTPNGERRTANGERRTANGERRTANGERLWKRIFRGKNWLIGVSSTPLDL